MNTKILMGASAALLALLGVCASFFPQEILARSGSRSEGPGALVIQLAGALYLGFAGLNWMARANLIGGIYSRPVALGNFFHFAVGGIALLKAIPAGQNATEIAALAIVYSAFAVFFGIVLFTHPRQAGKSER